jgi:hypothetical protein
MEGTSAIDVVVRKNGSPMIYPILKDPLALGNPVFLVMSKGVMLSILSTPCRSCRVSEKRVGDYVQRHVTIVKSVQLRRISPRTESRRVEEPPISR